MGAGLRASGKPLGRPPDPAVVRAPYFYPDTLGIDLGKNTMHTVGLDERGKPVLRRQFTRTRLIRYLARLPAAEVAMEACAGAHYVARKAQAIGHTPHILPARYGQAYVKNQKHDFADAEAIAEAGTRPPMREVAYEDVVRDPETELGRVLDFADIEAETDSLRAAVAGVRADSVGKGQAKLDQEAVHRLERLVGGHVGAGWVWVIRGSG